MKIGLVAEGHADVAVLRNILKGWLGLDGKDVLPIRPELAEDETDRARARQAGFSAPTERSYSNWGLVLRECGERARIADFLQVQLAGERLVVIQLDTAECHLPGYDVARPDRASPGYAAELRQRVAARIEVLLGAELSRGTRYAVAVEETDAWVLAVLEDGETDRFLDAKGRLQRTPEYQKARKRSRREGELYSELSRELRRRRSLAHAAERNISLKVFLESLGCALNDPDNRT